MALYNTQVSQTRSTAMYTPYYHVFTSVITILRNVMKQSCNDVNVWFNNNLARNGFHDLYGGYILNSCEYCWSPQLQCYLIHKGYKFHTSNSLIPSSFITCDPTRVCLCDNKGIPQCADMKYIERKTPPHYPGELFTVSAIVVGCGFGTISGIVHSEVVIQNKVRFTSQTQSIQ